MSTRYAVLHGPRSGRGRAVGRSDEVLAGLRQAGQDARDLTALDAEDARAVCRAAAAEGTEVLVVVGGDGLVSIAADACAGTQTAVGIVAAGSGNDNARSLAIPLRTGPAIQTLLTGRRRRIDLIDVQPLGRLVVGSVPAALDARIADRSTRVPSWLGAARYAVAALAEVPRLRAHPYRLEIDGEVWETPAMVVAVCNMPVFGGGMRIAPDADPTDGLLDVVVITSVRAAQALGLLAEVFTGRHAQHACVDIRRGRAVHVAGPELTAYGDGEALAPLPLTLTVRPAALDVVVPRG